MNLLDDILSYFRIINISSSEFWIYTFLRFLIKSSLVPFSILFHLRIHSKMTLIQSPLYNRMRFIVWLISCPYGMTILCHAIIAWYGRWTFCKRLHNKTNWKSDFPVGVFYSVLFRVDYEFFILSWIGRLVWTSNDVNGLPWVNFKFENLVIERRS